MMVWFYDRKKDRIDVDKVVITIGKDTIIYNGRHGAFPSCEWDGEYIICGDLSGEYRLEVNKSLFDIVFILKDGKIMKKIIGRKNEEKNIGFYRGYEIYNIDNDVYEAKRGEKIYRIIGSYDDVKRRIDELWDD